MDVETQRGTTDIFDDERADAARDLLRLFGRARRFVGHGRRMRQRDDADPQRLLAEVRRRLSEAILDDCLLFDEVTTLALFGFAHAWRASAYECNPDEMLAADAALEASFGRVAKALVQQGMLEGGPAGLRPDERRRAM